jgi:hypothetical protein
MKYSVPYTVGSLSMVLSSVTYGLTRGEISRFLTILRKLGYVKSSRVFSKKRLHNSMEESQKRKLQRNTRKATRSIERGTNSRYGLVSIKDRSIWVERTRTVGNGLLLFFF